MLRKYSGIMATLAIVAAVILGIGGAIIAVTTRSFWILIYFAVSAALFYFLLRSQAYLMETAADNADALAEIKQMLRGLDSTMPAHHAPKAAQAATTASGSDYGNEENSTPTVKQSAPESKPQSAYRNINSQADAGTLPNSEKVAAKIPTTDGRIKCSQCGHVQPAGQIKCFRCGAKFN